MSFVRLILLTTISVFWGGYANYTTSDDNEFRKLPIPIKEADENKLSIRLLVKESPEITTTVITNNNATVTPETERGYREIATSSARTYAEPSKNDVWSNGYTTRSDADVTEVISYGEETTTPNVLSSEIKTYGIENRQNLQKLSHGQSEEQKLLHPETADSTKVFVVHTKSISLVDTTKDEFIKNIVTTSYSKFYSIDYMYNESTVFFSDHNSIFRATFNGSAVMDDGEEIVSEGVEGPSRLAVDWIHNRLYWMSDKLQTVMSVDLESNNVTLLFDSNSMTMNFTYPNNIVVDPYEGYIFFVNNYVIYKSKLDGSELEVVDIDGILPGKEELGVRTITLDRANKMIYFSGLDSDSPSKHYLARIDYDTTRQREVLNTTGLKEIYSMDILGDTLYFAHFTDDGYIEAMDHLDCPESLMSINNSFVRASLQKLFRAEHCNMDIKSIKVFHKCAQDPECDGIAGPV